MTHSVLADAGPLFAALDPHDAHHRRATQELRKLTSEKRDILIAFPTLLETYSLVLFSLGAKIAAGWLSELADSSLVNPTSEDFRLAFARVRSLPDQRITLFDAVTAAMAMRLGLEVWTYDHHFDVMRVPVWRG
jgi:predicted nucleic acid-binding protein